MMRPNTFATSMKYSVNDCPVIELGKIKGERRGDLTVVENDGTLPFDVKRVFYLYDVPGGSYRGAHAHIEQYQFIIAASGSFQVTLDDGIIKRTFFLNRPNKGLLVYPGLWSYLDDFSSGAIGLVLTSDKYTASDYIRDYQDFLDYRNHLK